MKGYSEARTWRGGTGTGEELDIQPFENYVRKMADPKKPKHTQKEAGRQSGIVSRWHRDRGFGLIRLSGGKEIFVHISELRKTGIDRLLYGDRLSFELRTDSKGKEYAANVREM